MPQREARLDKDAQTKMMQYWHRKNEVRNFPRIALFHCVIDANYQEDKRLKENEDDDDYLNSSWANPKAYKNAFTGVRGGVKWK